MRIDEYSDPLDVYTPSIGELAARHKVPASAIRSELAIGIQMEMEEHTSDKSTAKEIALDHLSEHPDYYTRLKKANL